MVDFTELPVALSPFKDKIQATVKPTIEMTLVPATDLTLWESRVGGIPYLPLSHDYPLDSRGIPLKLLIQLNFAQMPALTDYPQKGILQIYIGGDDLYGANFDDLQKQADFRVLYFDDIIEDVAQLRQDFSLLTALQDDNFHSPITGEYKIEFVTTQQYISADDFNFGRKILDVAELFDYEDGYEGGDFYEEWVEPYGDIFSPSGHRIGGYPFFTQTDPREYRQSIQDYQLLLQIDTDYSGNKIMWGDMGVGNFFIHPDDLKKADFSKVVYNWDCG